MKKLTLPALAVTFLLASSMASLAQSKVGTVDMNKIFSSYYKTKDAESRINEARAAAKKELDDRMDTYKKTVDSINKLNEDLNNTALSKDKKDESGKKRDDMISETKNLEREIGEFRTTREKQLQEQAVRMRNGIVEEITKLVQEEVKSNSYDLVFDKSGQSLNGVPILLFSRDSDDFSDRIITALNKNRPKDTGAAPAEKAAPSPKK
ncbi:MAG: outer membrane protein [Chthoniobacter sp.]|jgi:outer membrane protein|nr:outer membrane protein [Chthoniobacter sp.]